MQLRKPALVVVPVCLSVLAGCGGSKSAAEKATEGSAQAKAACGVFVHFKPPTGTDSTSQIEYVKASYVAFLKAADLAGKAADLDPRWKPLQAAAAREAAAFETIAKATGGVDKVGGVATVNNAVTEAKTQRPVFIAECAKADPANFTPVASPSPSASPTATDGKKI